MVGFEKGLGAVEAIKDQIQYRSQSLLNLARGYFSLYVFHEFILIPYITTSYFNNLKYVLPKTTLKWYSGLFNTTGNALYI